MVTLSLVPMPDSITEQEVAIDIDANADQRTTRAIERKAKLMGFAIPNDYLCQAFGATIPDNEEVTVVAPKGRLAYGEKLYRNN
jgi:hypothetical protein